VSCTKPGYCTAGGDLYSGSGNYGDTQEGWVATESAGVWASPKVINFHESSYSYVFVNSISCVSPGNCAVVGYYRTATYAGYPETYEAFDINEVNGTCSAPKQIPGSGALNHGRWAAASSVSCSAPGDCAVAGNDLSPTGTQATFVATEGKGTLGSAAPPRASPGAGRSPRCHAKPSATARPAAGQLLPAPGPVRGQRDRRHVDLERGRRL
jgi:hypothetical protein